MSRWPLVVAALASVAAGVAPRSVAGGTGFADAPLLEAGQWADSVALGVARWYGVALADGQRLELTVTVRGRPEDVDHDGGGGREVQVALYTPLRAAVAPLPATAGIDAGEETTVTARSGVVGDGPAATAAGTWFASVAVVDPAAAVAADGDEAPPAWPVTLDVAVTQSRPATTTVLEGLTTTTTTTTVATEAAAADGDERDGVALGPPLGAAAGGLAVGILGGVAVARRRSRRMP